jgi:hypothetical protein
MDNHRVSKLQELRERVASGEYRVDSRLVADAIVRRRWSVVVAPRPALVPATASPEWNRARVRAVARTRALTGTQPLAA